MRSLFAFALLALAGVRAQHAERIFVDGKGVPNLAAATGSSTTTTDLIQAALTGSGSVLSQFINNPNYQHVDVNTFSLKPTTTPPLATAPPTSPTTSPSPAPAPTRAPSSEQEITLTGFSVPELSSSTSSSSGTAAPSTATATTAAPTTTTSTTAAPTTTTSTTAAPTTTTSTTAAPTTTTTTTATPTTTTSTTAALTTTTSTTAAPTTTTSTTAAPTTTKSTTAAPTTTTATTAAPTTTTSTTAAPTTTTSTTAAPTTTTSTTAAPTTTAATTAAPTTTTTTTATPTTTTSTTAALTTTKSTTAAPTTTTTTTAAPTTTTTTTAAPTTTTSITAAPTTTASTTAAPTTTTSTTAAPTTTTTTTATTANPSTSSTVALSTATANTNTNTNTTNLNDPQTSTTAPATTSQVVTSTTTNPTAATVATTATEAPEATAAIAASSLPSQTTTSANAHKASTAATIVTTGTAPPITMSTEALIATTEAPTSTTSSTVTPSVVTAETATALISTTAFPTTSQTTVGSNSVFGTVGTLPITDDDSVSHPSPELEDDDDNTLTAPDASKDNGSEVTESVPFTPEPETEALEPSPSSGEEEAEGSSVIGAPLIGENPPSTSDSTSQKSGPGSKPKKPIFVSATGSVTATAVFSGSGSAVVSAAVNKDPNKETETVTIVVTPAPEKTDEEPVDESDTSNEGSPEVSPESEAEAETQEPLIPKSPGRPAEQPAPTEVANDFIEDDSADSEGSTGSADPKMTALETFQALVNNVSTENAASPEPEGNVTSEPSSEPRVSITSALGSVLDSLPALEENSTPEPSTESLESAEVFPFSALANSLSSSFGNGDNVGPVPILGTEAEFGAEALETPEVLEATFGPFDVGDLLKSIEADIRASEEPEMSNEPEMSTEPEASTEELLPSGDIEALEVDLIVKHPVSLDAKVVSEEIRLVSDELTVPMQWTEVGLFLVSNLSKLGSAISVVRQADEIGTFELNLQSTCVDPLGCESEVGTYKEFIRDGRMDETLAAHDVGGVNVYLKGDLIDRSTPAGVDAVVSNGLNAGIIAGIAISAVAAISLLVYGILFVAKRGSSGNGHYDAEQGRIQSYDGTEDEADYTEKYREEEGSFMISNFGGSPRNTEALIPWMSNSSEGTGGHDEGSSSSFITVDTAVTAEIATNHLSNYRLEETTSSESDSDFNDLDVDDHRIA